MVKKIFDIIPPGASFKDEESQQLKFFAKKNDLRPQMNKPKEKIPFSSAKLLVPAAVLALLFGAAYFLIEAEAKIEIWPEASSAKAQDQVLLKAGVDGQQVDLEQKIIPALLVQNTMENKMAFSATGPIENKAKAAGTLRVYNKYEPPAAFTLVKGTRFLSPQEKYFKSLSVINLPAPTYKDGKLVPGFVDILVEADQSGADYNTESSATFSIPKLVGTNYFYTTWAENLKPLAGGSDTGVKTVTKDDLDKAKNQFLEESFKKAKTALASSVQADYVLLESLLNQEVNGDLVFSAKEKDARDTFEVSGKIASKAFVFKQSDVNAYTVNLLSKVANSSKEIVPGSLKIDPVGKSIDFGQQTAQLVLSVNAKTYMLDKEQKIKDLLKGQKLDYAASLINNSSGVEKANIILSPFWKNKLPSDTGKIQIKLIFDGE
ncbi:MAG: hypothetical protein WCX77_01335 [Candidatus Paceibacterota bacterium]|jgi:hypothetical protein